MSETRPNNPGSTAPEIASSERAENGRFTPTRDAVVYLLGSTVRIIDRAGAPYIGAEDLQRARDLAQAGALAVRFRGEVHLCKGIAQISPGLHSLIMFPNLLINVPYAVKIAPPTPLWLDLRCVEVLDARAL